VRASHSAEPGSIFRRNCLRAVAVTAVVVVSLQTPSAGRAAQDAGANLAASAVPAANSPDELARLEAQAAKLSKQYRGQLLVITETENAARSTMANALRLRRELSYAQRQLARVAVANYMGVTQEPALVILGGGDARLMLQKASMLEYLTGQRIAREHALLRLVAVEQRAGQVAVAKIAELRGLLATLASQRRQVADLMARFKPQSPVIGDNITLRMRTVKDSIDRRFGPFAAIGCYRPGTDGEHPLGRACDFMLDSGGVMPSASNVQLGYEIAAWAQANASRLGIMYIIYRQQIWDIRMASSGWVPMADRGGITANHFDHVHISVF
jgi:hypothetical protein